jgi:uncharacterized coiled-coil protein SlyX
MADFKSLVAVIQRLEAQEAANQEKTVANLKEMKASHEVTMAEMKASHQEMMPR